MKQGASLGNTQVYFQRVLDELRPAVAVEHPYAHNPTWQRTHSALRQWITTLGLQNARVLEIGCGTGILQDLVPNYIGTDIAANSRFYLHKPFCVCSAMELPFPSNSFDAVWTVWVLEHVNRPEVMLDEIRRVLKPGGTVFLRAAYAVESWISRGLHKRPFRELDRRQKLVKLTIPVRSSIPYKVVVRLQRRIRELVYHLWNKAPTSLRYRELQPNFETYWDYDADACVSLDSYSVALYFLSRGDEPYYPGGVLRSLWLRSQPQAYRIRK